LHGVEADPEPVSPVESVTATSRSRPWPPTQLPWTFELVGVLSVSLMPPGPATRQTNEYFGVPPVGNAEQLNVDLVEAQFTVTVMVAGCGDNRETDAEKT
jgi:hypothetical protein